MDARAEASEAPRSAHTGSVRRLSPGLLAPLAAGLALRLAFLPGALRIAPFGDETAFVDLALELAHAGRYDADYAPGYVVFLAAFVRLFGHDAFVAAKVAQVLLALVVGASTMALARAVFDRRTAVAAGWLWAAHVPLAAYTHLLWGETLFLALYLPALVLVAAALRSPGPSPGAVPRLAAAGALLGLAVLTREVAWYLSLALVPAIAVRLRRQPRAAAAGAGAFAAALALVIAPWVAHNARAFGAFVPSGTSLGINLFKGVNGHYRNNDLAPGDLRAVHPAGDAVRAAFFPRHPDAWELAREGDRVERNRENVRRALAFAAAHPGYVARTRVKKAADFVTPLSFVVRHLRLERYEGWMAAPPARRLLLSWALVAAAGTLALGWLGVARGAGEPFPRALLAGVAAYFAATAMIVSMSRYRVPIEPLWIAFAAHVLAHPRPLLGARPRARAAAVAGLAVLAFLWALNASAVAHHVRWTW